MRMTTIRRALVLATALNGVAALSLPQTAQKPAFEVASIKLAAPPQVGGPSGQLSLDSAKGRFVVKNMPVTMLLRYAFDSSLPEDEMLRAGVLFSRSSGIQVIGGPGWINSERFDIEAKPPQDHKVSQAEMQLMVQSLLEDRFALKAHREGREVPTYDLIVVKQGKMRLAPDESPSATAQGARACRPLPPGRLSVFGAPGPSGIVMTMCGKAVSVSTFLTTLQSWAGRPVADKTNFKGLFDVLFQFSPEQGASLTTADGTPGGTPLSSDPSGPSIFTAIEQELGLKLESSKGTVEVLVIDSVQKPSEN